LLPRPESVTFVRSKKVRAPVGQAFDVAPDGAEAETMNAPNSTPGERDLDALRRAQRAHEPSMEEILASIRSIIADDREPAAARSAPKPDATPSGPQIVYSKLETAPARAVEPPPAEPPTPKVVWSQPQPQPTPAASAPKPEPAPAAEEAAPLLSDQADEAVSAAFEALSTSLALQSSELAENAAREILRPLLKAWLDENLPSMVERLVKAEIQRVARGGR
jgi:cell pole-organizing protein PopZ